LPVVATSVRVGVRITGRNRQHLNGWNTRVRSAHDSAYKEIVKLGHVLTVRAFYFDLAARDGSGSEEVRARSRGNDLRSLGT